MVMNNRASLTLGDSNMKRHKEMEILEDRSSNNGVARSRTYSLIHVHLRVSGKPEFDRPITLSFSNGGGLVLLRVTDISVV
jgi:hypothetical protein